MRNAVVATLLLVSALLAFPRVAAADDAPTQGLRYPSLTPDNAAVVFDYRGDIWIAPTDGKGIARRLTIHEAQDTLPRVSPDGKQVAFSSRRDGGYDIFVVGIEGGVPKRVTFHGGPEILCDWSPDGKRLLFMTARSPSLDGMDLYEVPLDGGTPRPVTTDGGRDGSYHPDGKGVVYARGFVDIYWNGYEGGANFDLYKVTEPGALPQEITNTEGNERYPFYSPDGKTLYFVAEENGVANVYARPAEGGKRRQVTAFDQNILRPDLGWDGKTLVFEKGGRICITDLTAEKPVAKPLPIVIRSDNRHSGIEERVITKGPEQVDVSPDGTRLIFAVHGDLWTMGASGGEATRLTHTKASEGWPRFSPDGQTIAYQSDEHGNSDIYLMDLRSKKSHPITKNKADDFFHAWSPDGKRLVFASERSGNRDLWLLDLESGEEKQLTHDPAPDDDPVFSPDGRFVAFDSGRDGTQAIFIVPVDGGTPRRVSAGTAYVQVPGFSPDGSMIVFESMSQQTGRSGGLLVTSSAGGPQIRLTRDGTGARWSPRGDWIYYTQEGDGESEIYRHPAPTSIDMSEKVPFQGHIQVNLREELANLFDEIWQELYEGFYDPKMNGVDWPAMKKKYRAMAIDTQQKAEFQNVIRQMLAELSASHLGISGGNDLDTMVRPHQAETGQLGLTLSPQPAESGYEITEILSGGPADKVGLRVGDVVESVAGKKLRKNLDLDRILTGTVGNDLRVQYRPLTADGLGDARTTSLRPASWHDMWNLTYGNWTGGNAKEVKKETKGHIGYIHLLQMNAENLQKFQQAVSRWNQNPKIKGMILDIRFNGGGNIHQQLLQILSSKPFMQFKPRRKGDTAEEYARQQAITQPVLYWDKPVVVLVNQQSFSDAEVFPHAFRTAGLGELVGVQTAGGVIGTNDITLSDGSRLRIPRVAYIGMDGESLEGHGVEPDYVVEVTPEDRRKGRDPQLAKAIDVVMADVKARTEAERKKKAEEKKQPEETKPATTPESPRPKTPSPARVQGSDTNPLADASAGEWVRYRLAYGGSETVVKLQVAGVEHGVVRFVQTVESGGAFEAPFPDELPVDHPLSEALSGLGRTWDAASGKADLDGRPVGVWSTMLEWEGTPVRLRFSNAVPGLGLLDARVGGDVVLKAIDWSDRGAAPAAEPSASKPTAPGAEAEAWAAGGAPFPNPVHDAQEGEWVRYRVTAPVGEVELTLEVVAIEGDQVAVAATVALQGRTATAPVSRNPRSKAYQFPEGVTATWAPDPDALDVGGREVTCRVVTLTREGGPSAKLWISPDVPLGGIVREERDGKIVRELIDFGTGGAPVS